MVLRDMADKYQTMSAKEYYDQSYNAQGYQQGYPQPQVAGEQGEKGFLATVGGAAAGGYAGNKLSGHHSTLGGIAGAVAGAVLANKAENRWKHSHHQGLGSSHQGFGGHHHGFGGFNQGFGGHHHGHGRHHRRW